MPFTAFSLAGELKGLRDLRPSRQLDVKPYAVGGRNDDRVRGDSADDLDGGLDLKWGLTRSLVLDLTYNTDFAEVEVDDQQVNLTRFSLFFPEKRDFFLENAGVFDFGPRPRVGWGQPLMKPFFSRRIGLEGGRTVPIDCGVRLTGRAGGWNLGMLGIGTAGLPERENGEAAVPGATYGMARVTRNIGERSTIGGSFTHRDREGLAGERLYGLDFDLKPTQRIEFSGSGLRAIWDSASERRKATRPGARDSCTRGRNSPLRPTTSRCSQTSIPPSASSCAATSGCSTLAWNGVPGSRRGGC